ncbi:uncharacterized protein LOC135812676 [Sycon ciliatum]|uniref:uncharacterized protein LOC135812676 n=1 Tax=Sycon ciliatum TaxID=27933 RepID=UPI0020AEB624|eukprot:scpid63394/ scgid26144/ 
MRPLDDLRIKGKGISFIRLTLYGLAGRMMVASGMMTRYFLILLFIASVPTSNGMTNAGYRLGRVESVYYLTGQSTCELGLNGLPFCVSQDRSPFGGDDHQDAVLVQADSGIRMNRYVPPNSTTPFLSWDTATHHTLSPTYSGLYRCSRNPTLAPETYELNVVVPLRITVKKLIVLNRLSEACTATGYPKPMLNVSVDGVAANCDTVYKLHKGVWTSICRINLRLANATGRYLQIRCTANFPRFDCSPGQTQSVQDACNAASGYAEVSTPASICTQCKQVILLQSTPASGISAHASYWVAFSVFAYTDVTRTVVKLLNEFNTNTRNCASNFTRIGVNGLQVRLQSSPGLVEYFFPGPIVQGEVRNLANAEINITLLNQGTLGDLRLIVFYGTNGVQKVRLFRPPGQATDMFFTHPLEQTVCTGCFPDQAASVIPAPVPIPDPIPIIDPYDFGLLSRSVDALCQGD